MQRTNTLTVETKILSKALDDEIIRMHTSIMKPDQLVKKYFHSTRATVDCLLAAAYTFRRGSNDKEMKRENNPMQASNLAAEKFKALTHEITKRPCIVIRITGREA